MLIREARQEDAPYMADACIQVARFMRQGVVDKYILGFPDTVNGDMVKWTEGFVAAEKKVAFVADAAGERIGCIFGKIEESNMPMSVAGDIGTLSVCWVAPDHRRSGVGQALLAKTETWFLARGIRHLEVAFMVKNETAQEVWTHLGFSPFRVFAYKEISEQQTQKERNAMYYLNDMPFGLAKSAEDGPGFQIGDVTFDHTNSTTGETGRKFTDPQTGLHVHLRVNKHDNTIVVGGTLCNNGKTPVSGINRIDPLHVIFRIPSSAWRHIYAQGGTTEGYYPPEAYRTCERTRATGRMRIESHSLGRSSNLHLPFLISLASRSPDSEGLFCGMEWSGGWHMTWEPLDAERSAFSVGVKVTNLTLMPGEVLALPNVHLGLFKGGPDAGTNALRRHLYTHVCPLYRGARPSPKVSYDHWFGLGNGINIDVLKRQAKRAAELGIEVFVVDAGWFTGGFPHGVGNWNSVDREKFPDGLEPLAEYVRSLDMDFGLWFEIERASEGTQALRRHPEFFIPVPPSHTGNRLHLNLARQDAQDWAIETVSGWIRRLDLKWSRWDYNINPQPFWNAVDPSGKIQFDYMAGLYRVLDTLMSAHPEWMVEGCASGGRRIDMGTMKRAHTFWFSDHSTSAAICRYMQARANRFLPGHLLNSSVAVGLEHNLAHMHGECGFNDVSVLSRMLGKLAFDGDVASWSPELSDRMGAWVKEFKRIRHLLVQDFYQLLPTPATAQDWDVVEFVSSSGDEAAVFVFSGCDGGTCRFLLRGLDPELTYQVSRSPDGSVTAHCGADLITSGLAVEMADDQAGLWRIIDLNKTRISTDSESARGR